MDNSQKSKNQNIQKYRLSVFCSKSMKKKQLTAVEIEQNSAIIMIKVSLFLQIIINKTFKLLLVFLLFQKSLGKS